MKSFYEFEEALDEFKESGGAMNFVGPILRGEKNLWQVGEAEEIREVINEDISVRTATEIALREGGLTEEQIAEVLEGWVDEEEKSSLKIGNITVNVPDSLPDSGTGTWWFRNENSIDAYDSESAGGTEEYVEFWVLFDEFGSPALQHCHPDFVDAVKKALVLGGVAKY